MLIIYVMYKAQSANLSLGYGRFLIYTVDTRNVTEVSGVAVNAGYKNSSFAN
jgi:hypothetical protein